MNVQGPAKLLVILIDETDQWQHRPLYQAIVEKAHEAGLAGATVTRAIMGFGAHSRVHSASVIRLSEDLPVRIEIVDTAERIDAFLPTAREMVREGLITTADVTVC